MIDKPARWFALVLSGWLLTGLIVTGCGFQPLYGTRAPAAQAPQGFPDIRIALIDDRLGQILRNTLLDRINPRGRNPAPRYRLEIAAEERRSDTVILRDATATFAKLSLEARWVLVDNRNDAPVIRGTAHRSSSFSISDSEFAILQAEADARRRAAGELADDIRLRLALYFQRAPQSAGRVDQR